MPRWDYRIKETQEEAAKFHLEVFLTREQYAYCQRLAERRGCELRELLHDFFYYGLKFDDLPYEEKPADG